MARKHKGPRFRPLTFGKHRGVPLDDVPHQYLEWVLKTVSISERVDEDIRGILMGRKPPRTSRPAPIVRYCEPAKTTNETTPRWVPWDDSEEPGGEGEIESRLTEADIPF